MIKAHMYCDDICKVRIVQKMRYTIRGGSANDSIFVAKLVRDLYRKKGYTDKKIHKEVKQLFGNLSI